MLKKITKIIVIILCAMLIVSFIVPSFSNSVFAAVGEQIEDEYSGSAIEIIKEQVAMWYYIIRTICIAIMLILLIFIGINLAIKSSIAADRAFYKKMLVDWFAGMILVFGIHYIMIAILSVNDMTVNLIAESGKAIYRAGPEEYGDIRDLELNDDGSLKDRANDDIETSIFENLRTRAYEMRLSVGMPGMFLYGAFVYYAWKYAIIYLRRVFNIWILTLLGPPISVSYALNKTLTGKSKLFGAWLREYMMNTFIQSIHALCYVTFTLPVLKFSLQGFWGMALSVVMLKFMADGDKIIRKVFSVGGGEGSVIGSIAGKNVGKDAIMGAVNAYKSVAGVKAVRSMANLERKVMLAPAAKLGKAGFGKVMAHRKNKEVFDKRFEKDLEFKKAEYAREHFGLDLEYDNEKDEHGVARISTGILNEEQKTELNEYEESLRKKKADKKNKGYKRINSGKVKKGEFKGRTYGEAIDVLGARLNQEKLDYEAIKNSEELTEEEKQGQLAKIQKDELALKDLVFARDRQWNAQLYYARKGLAEVFDPNLYTEKQIKVKYNPKTGKEEQVDTGKYVAKKTEKGKRTGFFTHEKEKDGLSTRIKKNLSFSSINNLNEEEKKAIQDAKKDVIDSSKVLLGVLGGVMSWADSGIASGGFFAMAAEAQSSKIQRQGERVAKMEQRHQAAEFAVNFEQMQGVVSPYEMGMLTKYANIALMQEKDKYIVHDITKKHNKLVKFMMSGQMKATNTLARWGGGKGMAMYYRGGSDGTHSMSMGQTVREIEINKYYEQERKNNQKYLSQVANVLFGKDSPLEDQLLELYGVDENGKKIEGYQLPKKADGSIDFGQLDISKLSELKGAKAQMEALASILDSEVNSLSSEDLLMAAAVAQGLAYDTGNEVLNLSGEQISEDTFSEKKKSAKEDKAGFFVVIAVDNINVSNDETQERIEGEVTEEVDEYTGQKRETTKIKITRKDAEEAIKQAVMEMGFASVAEFGKSSRASRDQAIGVLIANLKKEGIVVGNIEAEKSVVDSVGEIIDKSLTTMVAREEVNAATVEVMEEIADSGTGEQFTDEQVQERIQERAQERLVAYAESESSAFSGDKRMDMDRGSVGAIDSLGSMRETSFGDGKKQESYTGNADISSLFTSSSDASSRVTDNGDASSQVTSNGDASSTPSFSTDVGGTVGPQARYRTSGGTKARDSIHTPDSSETDRTSGVNPYTPSYDTSSPSEDFDTESMFTKDSDAANRVTDDGDASSRVTTNADAASTVTADADAASTVSVDPDAGSIVFASEESRKERLAQLQQEGLNVLKTNLEVNQSKATKVKSKGEKESKLSKEKARQLADEVKAKKREEIVKSLLAFAEQDTIDTANRATQTIRGEQVSPEKSVTEMFGDIGRNSLQNMISISGSDEMEDPQMVAKKQEIAENLAACVAAYQRVQAEKAIQKDYTEPDSDRGGRKDMELLLVGGKKTEEQKRKTLGIIGELSEDFRVPDYDKYSKAPGVGRELNNLVTVINNTSRVEYSDSSYANYESSAGTSSQGGRHEDYTKRSLGLETSRNTSSDDTRLVTEQLKARAKNSGGTGSSTSSLFK